MADLIHEYATWVQSEGQTFVVRAYAARQSGGTWIAWLEFEPVGGGGPILRTDRETSQASREAVEVWASGLEATYLEGAFTRAHLVSAAP
jgi:hypothetical protein